MAIYFLIFLSLINIFLLTTILVILSKILFSKPKLKINQSTNLVDLGNQSRTYGDIERNRPLSTDITLLKDE